MCAHILNRTFVVKRERTHSINVNAHKPMAHRNVVDAHTLCALTVGETECASLQNGNNCLGSTRTCVCNRIFLLRLSLTARKPQHYRHTVRMIILFSNVSFTCFLNKEICAHENRKKQYSLHAKNQQGTFQSADARNMVTNHLQDYSRVSSPLDNGLL